MGVTIGWTLKDAKSSKPNTPQAFPTQILAAYRPSGGRQGWAPQEGLGFVVLALGFGVWKPGYVFSKLPSGTLKKVHFLYKFRKAASQVRSLVSKV